MDFLAPLIVSSLSAGLALMISIVDAIVNNYGEVEININKGKKKLKVKGGSPLLQTLAAQNIFVPSACGGRGSCGVCKVKIFSDVGPYLPTELPHLSKEEMASNVRLSCQIKVKKDLQIELPEELFKAQRFKGIVESIKDLTYDIKEIRIRLVEPDSIDFLAGQYIQLVIPPYGKVEQSVQRAYSISSPPSDSGHIELVIRLVPGGIATTYVFNYMKEGEIVEFVGPFGEFYMRNTKADMIMIAGGSGMAPIKSIVLDMIDRKIKDRNVWFFFGARSKRDLFYVELFRTIEKDWDRFHFIPALSNPNPEDDWTGELGLITEVVDRYLMNKIPKESEKEAYLCGSPGMINASIQVLQKHGINKIYYDKFA
ncbi:2Fe-2S iron-sulfur cluster binding domain-containing protein [Pseudothermotoga sp.]|uniref:NADH:ubiquinone reductase (Na(+)-transporting) subunit F n=1 Tax=Pseudothermotoga sp. TaxID=2033661 RepID=UPI0031F6DC30